MVPNQSLRHHDLKLPSKVFLVTLSKEWINLATYFGEINFFVERIIRSWRTQNKKAQKFPGFNEKII